MHPLMKHYFQKIFFSFLLCSFHYLGYGQKHISDSLMGLLKMDKPDTNKLAHLNSLTWRYYTTGVYDSAILFSGQALSLSKQILATTGDQKNKQTTQKREAAAWYMSGVVRYAQGNFPEALQNLLNALRIYNTLNNTAGIATTSNSIGNVYTEQQNYTEALKNYSLALKAYEKAGNKSGIASAYSNIGTILILQGNYTKASESISSALEIRREMNDPVGMTVCYNNLATIYYVQATAAQDKSTKQKNLDKALETYLTALTISEKADDKAANISSYTGIGNIYIAQKQYAKAEEYLFKAKETANGIGAKSKLVEVYSSLVALDSSRGDFKSAYQDHKLYTYYRDSVDNEETRKRTIQNQMTFDFEKKEAVAEAEHKKELESQQALAAEKSRKQYLVITFIIAGLLLVLVFAGFVLRSLRLTRKQKQIIEEKSRETEMQKDIIEEKHKEITDSINYAERIQRSFLASKSLLDENLRDYFVFFQPKDVVSGDFYWAGKLQDGRFALATADSTGHGVPGAIMSILNISSLERAVEAGVSEPSEILNQTRQTIIARLKKDGSPEGGKDGMDCSLVCFDMAALTMSYAAANNPVWVVRSALLTGSIPELIELKADKMPVGKHDRDSQPFSQHEVSLQPNDVVYTFTDGFPDQFGGPRGKKFMYKQLKELLLEISSLPMAEQEKILKEKFTGWKADHEQVDDVLLTGIRISGN
ncbi:MAG: hypothetical protein JWO09_3781 [Bacteroidetes bacterium]|nr:hypothetical protein [Bacteroidota bacterium]